MNLSFTGAFAANIAATGELEGRNIVQIEQESTNEFLSPRDISAVNWTKTKVTAFNDEVAGPNGAGFADRIREDTGSGSFFWEQSRLVDGSSKYINYVIIKPVNREWIYMSMDATGFPLATSIY
jgi:hypothetical protein